jgi:HK97 family phage portal protein
MFGARRTKDQPVGGWLLPTGTRIPGVRLYDWRQPLQIPAVYRCVSLVANTVATLPWRVFREGSDGKRSIATDNKASWLLHRRASRDMSAFTLKQTLLVHSMLQGNGYAEIERDVAGRPYALWLIDDPDRVTPGRLSNGKIAYAVRQADGGEVILPAEDMLHIKGLGTDGIVGLSLLEVAARSMGSNLALEELLPVYFRQGMRTPGFIKTKGKMSPEALKSVMKLIKEEFTGVRNFEMPIPLDNDMEFQAAGSTFRDAQYIDLRKFGVLDICRWFGVPPHMAFDLDRATFSNIEHQGQDFLTYALLPRIVPMEQEADIKLLSDNWGGLFSKMNTNAIVRGDLAARTAFYQAMRNMGVYTVNRILELEDESTIGPEGDVRVMQVQYQPTAKKDAPDDGADDSGEEGEPTPPAPRGARGFMNRVR